MIYHAHTTLAHSKHSSGAAIEFTITSLVGDVDCKLDFGITVNGKEMRALGFGKSNGMNIFKFNFRPQDNEMAVVISDKIMEKASQMRNSAKALIADAVAEFNGIEHAERRANRS
jgi:hypothetical protein